MRGLWGGVTILLVAGACGGDDDTTPTALTPDHPTVRRYLQPIVPFDWDYAGADERKVQLLAAAATGRHVVIVYPAPEGGTSVAWGGLDEPWQSEALSPIGLADAIGVDAATGPDDTVHVAFLRLRDPADAAPIVIEHLAWRAGEGVVETTSVAGAPVAARSFESTEADLSIGVRRDGTVDVVVGQSEQQVAARWHDAIDLFSRPPGEDAFARTRIVDDATFLSADEIEIGRFARVTYDTLDRPLVVHWVRDLTNGTSYGPEVLVQGDDGLFSPSQGPLANVGAEGRLEVDGQEPYRDGYPDAWVDPEYGWVYVTPLGGRADGLAPGVAAVAMRSIAPWPPEFPVQPHARRDDILYDGADGSVWVGGRLLTSECRGVETAAETLYDTNRLRSLKGTTSRGRVGLCGYARVAPVMLFQFDEQITALGGEAYPVFTQIDADDVNASLVRYRGWRTVYAHGHRPFDVGVTPLERLVVTIGGYEIGTASPLPWPADDLLRIVSSDPPDGAEDAPPDLREIRVRVTGVTGHRDQLFWQGFDLANGQPAITGPVEPGASEDELVLRLDPEVALVPGIRYRVWIFEGGGSTSEPFLYPWQYVDGGEPVITFRTAGEPPPGAYAPDPRGTPLTVSCSFCLPDGDAVAAKVPRAGSEPSFEVGASDDEIDTLRVDPTMLVLRDEDGAAVPCDFDFLQGRGRVRVGWTVALVPDREYTIELPEGFRTILGRTLTAEQRVLRFRTAP